MQIYQIAIRCLLVAEILTLYIFYFFGNNSLLTLNKARQVNIALEDNIDKNRKKILLLEKEITEWQLYPFYKERFAREHLQLGHKNEILYLLD